MIKMINNIKQMRKTIILLLVINFLILSDLKANCPIVFSVDNITDNSLTNNTVIVDYSVTFNAQTSASVSITGLPVNYTYTPISMTFGPPTTLPTTYSGTVTILVAPNGNGDSFDFVIGVGCSVENIVIPCINCIGSFAPTPGERYVLSAWVKEDTPNQVETHMGPEIELDFGVATLGGFKAKGNIIDGWQKIEEVITIPASSKFITFKLNNTGSNDVYFDDIRISPFNSSMKTYVYDPVSLRLWAELDDRNYATFYQYDEEGKLIRIKKETAKGVETIQESREGFYKKEKVFDEKLNLNDSSN